MNKFADIDEIRHAHAILLKDKPFFESDKIKIIECDESQDIKACPGSGKTTTLLAKLIILANRMPLENNQGICVLTHTNVSIDEIKSKLGNKADILFKYPNHFGTIQSFVDKFLAIPYFAFKFGKRPMQISNDVYNNCYNRSYWSKLKQLKTSNLMLYNRLCSYFITNSDVFNYTRLTIINGSFELINIKTGSIIDFKRPRKSKNSDWSDVEKAEMKGTVISIIKNVYQYYSVFSYSDAYTFSSAYTLTIDTANDAFSSRFKYLFIDEMQDTDKQQLEIIEKLFDREKTIVQRFGDHHQAIYNKISPEELWKPKKSLPINSSKRFGENIAKVLRTICIEDNYTLIANPDIESLNPILILFDNPTDVLPKYCELLKTNTIGGKTIWEIAQEENKKDPAKRKNVKAVGWVGDSENEKREKSSFTIKSYFEVFNKQVRKKEKVNYDSLKSFLRKQDKAKVKDYSDKIIDALLHILSITNIKNTKGKTKRDFTKTSLIEEYENKAEQELIIFRSEMVRWAKDIHNCDAFDDAVIEQIKVFITTKFCPLFGVDITNTYLNKFIDNDESNAITEEEIEKNNIFEEDGMQVEVGTIHSVKGETHIATLYLETSYHGKHESEMILQQMKGIPYSPPKRKKDTYMKETLKMAYVGMSRPRYLLCFAIHRSRFDEALNIDNGGMWEVVYT